MANRSNPIRPPAGIAGQGAENGDPDQTDRVMTDLFWRGALGWQNREPMSQEFRQLRARRERALGAGRLLALDERG